MRARCLICSAMRQLAWDVFEVPDVPASHAVVVKSACSLISADTAIALYRGSHRDFPRPNPSRTIHTAD